MTKVVYLCIYILDSLERISKSTNSNLTIPVFLFKFVLKYCSFSFKSTSSQLNSIIINGCFRMQLLLMCSTLYAASQHLQQL